MSTLRLPSPILSISPSDLFDLIRLHCGQDVLNIITAQKIHDIQTLLRVPDLFTLIRLPTDDFRDLKGKVAVQLYDGSWSILAGIQARVDHFIKSIKDQAQFDENEHDRPSDVISTSGGMILSAELLDKFPVLSSLTELCTTIDSLPNQSSLSSLICILNNICANLKRVENNYRYSHYVSHFALSLFIYAGHNAYRLVSLNIPGLLPSIPTIRKMLTNSFFRMHEAEFRFEAMLDHFNLMSSNLAFAAEDCTGVVAKVVYDSISNAFIGFNTPIKRGKPTSNHSQTDSFTELQRWFKEKRKSTSINLHMVQPLFASSSSSSDRVSRPFLLSAYGIDGTFTAEDVLNRWLWIYEETKRRGIRIIGFSTDCDPRYLRSMRVASGFFVSDLDRRFQSHPDAFKINIPRWEWFLMSSPQLLFFMQVNNSRERRETSCGCPLLMKLFMRTWFCQWRDFNQNSIHLWPSVLLYISFRRSRIVYICAPNCETDYSPKRHAFCSEMS